MENFYIILYLHGVPCKPHPLLSLISTSPLVQKKSSLEKKFVRKKIFVQKYFPPKKFPPKKSNKKSCPQKDFGQKTKISFRKKKNLDLKIFFVKNKLVPKKSHASVSERN